MPYDLLFYAIILVGLLIGVAWGLWRKFTKSLIHLGCTLVAAILAFVITLSLKNNLADLVTGLVDMAALNELMTIAPSLNQLVLSSAGAILLCSSLYPQFWISCIRS